MFYAWRNPQQAGGEGGSLCTAWRDFSVLCHCHSSWLSHTKQSGLQELVSSVTPSETARVKHQKQIQNTGLGPFPGSCDTKQHFQPAAFIPPLTNPKQSELGKVLYSEE